MVSLLPRGSVEDHSHIQGATNVADMYNVQCRLPVTNGEMFVNVTVVHKYTRLLKSY
jgi:hypothetical protein